MQGEVRASCCPARYTGRESMAKKNARRLFTPRDYEVLAALDRTPLTADQLLQLSATFAQPFTHERLVRRRLQSLTESGWIRSWPYAVASRGGSPRYHKLSRGGYRLVHGDDARLPTRRHFEEIAPGRHHHTHSLASFIVQLTVKAAEEGIAVRHFARENSTRIESDGLTLFPDCVFQLVTPSERTFNFIVELDNSTETVRSRPDIESIERKIRGYDRHQAQYTDSRDPRRYCVLFVTTRSAARLNHILSLAEMVVSNPRRTVFVGVTLSDVLRTSVFEESIVRDHRGLRRTLVPREEATDRTTSATTIGKRPRSGSQPGKSYADLDELTIAR